MTGRSSCRVAGVAIPLAGENSVISDVQYPMESFPPPPQIHWEFPIHPRDTFGVISNLKEMTEKEYIEISRLGSNYWPIAEGS